MSASAMYSVYSWLLVGFLISLLRIADAQNLVPNGSFETYRTCPQQNNLLSEAIPWYNPNQATPDFYHACFSTGQMLLPPHSGQGVAHLFFDQGWAEYLSVRLKKPLNANECYYFDMYVATGTPNKYQTGTLGAYFSVDSVANPKSTDLLAVKPQVLDNTLKNDVGNLQWLRIGGFVKAKGGEQYITIGTFGKTPPFLGFYDVFVDDVSLLPLSLELGKDSTLCGRTSTLLLNATVPGASYYQWSDGSKKPELLVTKPGKYSVTVITDCNTLRDSITIDYALSFDLGRDTTLCNGQTLTLIVPASTASTYRWQDGSRQPTFTVRQEGRYSVRVSQASCVVSDSIYVRYIRPPALELGPDQALCGAQLFTIQPTVAEGKFFWLDQVPGVARTVSSSGVYRASVQNDCATVTDSVSIDYNACECVLYAPTSFTPNDDGLNDIFLAYGCGDITITSLAVYNRWGEVVFQTSAVPFQWDGYSKGYLCETGVYAWSIQYRLNQRGKTTSGQKQGSLTLLR